MKKLILPIIVVIIIVIVIIVLPKTEDPIELEEKTDITYTNNEFSLTLPSTWEGFYEVEIKENNTIFTYLPENDMETLLLIISTHPGTTSVFSLKNTPNTVIIAQTMETIFTYSQALDIPYQQGTADHDRYIEMIEQVDSVLESIKTDDLYALNKNIREFKDDKLFIDVNYPEIDQGINQTIKQEIEKIMNEFKTNFEEWGDMDVPEGAFSGFYADYEIKILNDKYASIYFIISENLAGAAHPNNFSHSLNFDMQTKQKLELDDLFTTKDYLTTISELVIGDLKEQFEERGAVIDDTFTTGTEAKKENYSNFNITEQGIIFNFDSYQVAAYAVGGFNSLIYFEELDI